MTLDQKIQLWVAAGTWFAGFATLAAVIVALYLSKRVERVHLKVQANMTEVLSSDGRPPEEHFCVEVTNLGERAVTINTVGWAVGKGKKRRLAIQILAGRYTAQYPAELAYGKSANFMVSLLVSPDWARDFATGFLKDLSDKYLDTLRVLVHTSVGQTVEVRPHKDVLEEFKKARVTAREA